MKNEEEHIDVREKLLKLPRVKARDGFENELLRRINLLDAETLKSPATKNSFWEYLFGKRSLAWTVPAMSLSVIVIVFVGVYFAFFNSKVKQKDASDKSTASQQSSVESLKTFTSTPENKSAEIPGRDIANDLEISKSPKTMTKSEDKGYMETYIDNSPKPIAPSKTNVIDSKKENTVYEKADDVGRTGKILKQADEKDVGNMNNGVLKEEKRKEEPEMSKDMEKKISAPLIKDADKLKKDTTDGKKKDKEEKKKEKAAKSLTKEALEELKEKIKEDQ